MLKYWIIFTAALTFSIVFTSLLARVSLKYRIFRAKDIPLAGGVGIGLAFIFSLGLGIYTFDLSVSRILAVAAAGLLMLFLGIVDDLKELSVAQKFLGQAICAVLLISFGIRTDIMYFGFWPNAVITFIWILGITNAFNLLDIMDGLAAGSALIVSSAFLVMGFLSADLNTQVLGLILCAASLGFLIFNLPPARVYLGNSGSHFLGLLIASIALMTRYASASNVFALLGPVLILGLPIIDTVLLIIFRLAKGRPPFSKSKDHIALKIGSLGFSPAATISIMYLLCSVFAACGVILTRVNNLLAAVITISVFLLSIGIFLKLIKIKAND